MDFRTYISKNILSKSDRILELGPLDRPIAIKDNFSNTVYADIRATEDIKKLYTSNDYLKSTGISIDINEIVDIDYVINDSYKNTFSREGLFDAVILSHVVEHMPDIIFFFKDISSILAKNGKLILIYPDSRYCFDHYRVGTRFIDAYDVFKNKKINSKAVFDFSFNVIKGNIPADYWSGGYTSELLLPKNDFQDSIGKLEQADLCNMPDDVHFWPFADYQFLKFLYDMDRAGLNDFDIKGFYRTQFNTQEFMVILTPKKRHTLDFGSYQKIARDLCPEGEEYRAKRVKQKIDDLSDKIKSLENENKNLSNEITGIISSRSYKLASKVASIKNRMIDKNE